MVSEKSPCERLTGENMKKILGIAAFIFALGTSVFAQNVQIRKMGSTNSASEILSNGKSKYVSVFAINDFHGSVEEDLSGKNPGAAKLYEVVSELKAVNPESIFVSAGDNYQGSALSNLSGGKVVSDFFNYADLAVSTIGNHEFDWGEEKFAEWEKDGNFNFIACNLVYKKDGKKPEWLKDYELYNIGGHLICVIGTATVDTIYTASKNKIEDFEFLDPAKSVRKVLRKVDALYHPEAVIVLSHIGSHNNRLFKGNPVSADESTELEDLCRIKGIDAVITGHSHEYVNGLVNGVPVVQAINYGRAISQIKLKFNNDGLVSAKGSVIEVYKEKDSITENADVLSLVASYKTKYGAQLGETIAFVEEELSHEENVPNVTPLGYVIASAMKAAFKTDFAVTNGGGLRKSINAGTLTVNDMWELIPFDNTGVIATVSGATLKKIVDHGINTAGFRAGQFAGGTVYYTTQKPEGSRVTKIVLDDGRTVEDSETYTVVVNDFMAEGGDKYDVIATEAKSLENTYIPFRDAVSDVLKSWGTISKTYAQMPKVLVAQ